MTTLINTSGEFNPETVELQDEILSVPEIKDTDKDLLVEEDIVMEDEKIDPENQLVNIKGFIEVLSATPTHIPKTFADQMKIYNGTLYVYDYVNNNWIGAGAKVAAGGGTRASATGTGDVTITCGFEPKMIKITAYCDLTGGWTGWSVGHATTTSDSMCLAYAYSGTVWEKLTSATKCIFVWNSGESLNSQASVTAISSTGFTLNFSTMGVNVRYMWEAWG